jgi:hypothetical protein
MKQRLMTPGPSPAPEETLLELAKPVTYHRSAQFRQLLGEVLEDLKYVYCTRNPIAVLTASGTGGMEAAVANCLAPGSKAIVAVAGKFGERWRSIAKTFGVEASVCPTAKPCSRSRSSKRSSNIPMPPPFAPPSAKPRPACVTTFAPSATLSRGPMRSFSSMASAV